MDLIIGIACIGVFIYFLYLIVGYLDAREDERVFYRHIKKRKRERRKRI